MLAENNVMIFDFVWAISEAVDLVAPVLNRHHKKVAYIAGNIALEMGIGGDELQDIVIASMLHDIGAFSLQERLKTLNFDASGPDLHKHSYYGYELLKNFGPLANAAILIKYHHVNYCGLRQNVPIGSYVLHLADRVSLLFDDNKEVLSQIPLIRERLMAKQKDFHQDAFAALNRLLKSEYFCIEASSSLNNPSMFENIKFAEEIASLGMLRDFAKMVSQLIDFRNRFTASHSSGVAAVVKELSELIGFSDTACKMMEIAGYLHDLGKLAISNDILEKNGALNETEYNNIRKHTYYTYIILKRIRGLGHIATWAAHHHERPDGNGYPFRVKGRDFSKESRIMAVADIFTAITEDRPYRAGMNRRKVEGVLRHFTESGGADEGVVELAIKYFMQINEVRKSAQNKAQKDYDNFRSSIYKGPLFNLISEPA